MQLIERPAAEKRKIHSSNDFELCYIRHQYFRRVKYNPTAEEMAPYRKIIGYLSQRTFYTYASLFHLVGMTIEDVNAIGQINLVNYLGLFRLSPEIDQNKYDRFCKVFKSLRKRRPDQSDILNKNKADLTMFMKQRMTDLVRICRQKAKNIKGLRVDEYIPFYGAPPPPEDLYKLLLDNEAYGYYRCDINQYKAIRKRAKKKVDEIFLWAGNHYLTVPLDHRSITVLDLAGAGMDPYESLHNLNPEQILFRRETEIRFDKHLKKYKNSSKEDKAKTILDFVEKNSNNPIFKDEIVTARKLLRNMGVVDGRPTIEG
jgi:hypothetical protein